MKANSDIRKFAKIHGVFLWQIAEKLNISEPTMTRKLRRELCVSEKKQMFDTIIILAKEKSNESENTTSKQAIKRNSEAVH